MHRKRHPTPPNPRRFPIPPPPAPPEQGASAVANRVLRLYADDDGLDIDGLLPRSMDVCHQYLMVLGRDKEWEQALDFFSQLLGRARPPPDQNCYDAVLYGLNRAERWVETVEVMDSFRRRVEESQHELKPRRRLYLSALSTLLKVVSGIWAFGLGGGRDGGRVGWVGGAATTESVLSP